MIVEMKSFADYPQAVKNNAKRGIELNEKNGNKCATQTGKVRAQQLAKGEAISVETIKRMYSYLSRAEEYYDPNDTKACGTISYLLWGGKAALRWSKSKLKELELSNQVQCEANTVKYEAMKLLELIIEDEEVHGVNAISLVENPAIEENWVAYKGENKVEFATADEEQRIIAGAILVPDKPIYRNVDGVEQYWFMSKETVKKAAHLYLKRANQANTTFEHQEDVNGVTLVESWIVEGENDKSKNYGMDLPKGTWFGLKKVDNDTIWNEYVKTGEVKGFSIEGFMVAKGKDKEPSYSEILDDLLEMLE